MHEKFLLPLIPVGIVIAAALNSVEVVLRAPGVRAGKSEHLAAQFAASVNLDDWRGASYCRLFLGTDSITFDAYGLASRTLYFAETKVVAGVWNDPGEFNIFVLKTRRRLTLRTSVDFASQVLNAFGKWSERRSVPK